MFCFSYVYIHVCIFKSNNTLGKCISVSTFQDSVQNYAVCGTPDLEIIDAPHREWIPGLDYVILGPQPATEHRCGQTDALPKSLSFQIKHLKTSNKFQLKVHSSFGILVHFIFFLNEGLLRLLLRLPLNL